MEYDHNDVAVKLIHDEAMKILLIITVICNLALKSGMKWLPV